MKLVYELNRNLSKSSTHGQTHANPLINMSAITWKESFKVSFKIFFLVILENIKFLWQFLIRIEEYLLKAGYKLSIFCCLIRVKFWTNFKQNFLDRVGFCSIHCVNPSLSQPQINHRHPPRNIYTRYYIFYRYMLDMYYFSWYIYIRKSYTLVFSLKCKQYTPFQNTMLFQLDQ